jgi:hypothetical protein
VRGQLSSSNSSRDTLISQDVCRINGIQSGAGGIKPGGIVHQAGSRASVNGSSCWHCAQHLCMAGRE